MKIISAENKAVNSQYGLWRQTIEAEVNNKRVTIEFTTRSYKENSRTRRRKSRLNVYGDLSENIVDNFMNRTRRPHAIYRKEMIPVLEAFNLPTKGIRWSQYAWCSCPCSPGFIMPTAVTNAAGDIVDIDITIHEDLPLADESKPVDPNRAMAIGALACG